MMEERRNYSNFCNNIRRYHGKKHQQQFYDFTIRDKDGVEVKSHKFILASQCSYFAGLFRIHPNSSETTFADFSLDEIKMCTEYLYTYKVKLTGKNDFRGVILTPKRSLKNSFSGVKVTTDFEELK